MQNFDVMAEHGNATGAPVVAGIAVFKAIDAAQLQTPGIIACQAQRIAYHAVVKELQALAMAGIAGSLHANFPCLQAVEPEPDAKCNQEKKQ